MAHKEDDGRVAMDICGDGSVLKTIVRDITVPFHCECVHIPPLFASFVLNGKLMIF